MSESPSYDESSAERNAESFLTREEALSALQYYVTGNAVLTEEESDEKGVFLLELSVTGEQPDETTFYRYQRKALYGKNLGSTMTTIQVSYVEGGMPVGGKTLADYDEKTGVWVRQ